MSTTTQNTNFLTGTARLINCKEQKDKDGRLVGVAMQAEFNFGDDLQVLDLRAVSGRESKILGGWNKSGQYEMLYTIQKGTGTLGEGRGTYSLVAVKVWDIKKVA